MLKSPISRLRLALLLVALLIAGCSSHPPPINSRLADPIATHNALTRQLNQWRGTPYRYGGLSRSGIDCSGFVYRTFRDRFGIRLPRTTTQQSRLGNRIDKEDLLPGDLVFFKTGWGSGGLHVGIVDVNQQFIHASASRGVMRSSLKNVYWRKVFWQGRRL